MKKYFFLVSFAILALISCKKDYQCICTTNSNGDVKTSSYTIYNSTDTKAKVECDSKTVGPNGEITTCTLE
jgi:hypothetical protein